MQKNLKTVRLVLFDLDGTLADTGRDMANALNVLLGNHGKPPVSYDRVRPYVSGGTPALLKIGFGVTPEAPEFEKLRQEFLNIYANNLCNETILFEGMPEFLEQCRNRNVKWGVVTNKPENLSRMLLDSLGVGKQAASIVGGDTLTVRKPNPEPVLHACKQAETSPEFAMYVGDAERDIVAGKKAGLETIAVTYGYIPPDEFPDKWGANHIAHSPGQVADILWNSS